MGKSLSHASHKISKKEKQQLNTLIKASRPKVYITDCSTFKELVQEVTGNGSSTTSLMIGFPLVQVQTDVSTDFETKSEQISSYGSDESLFTFNSTGIQTHTASFEPKRVEACPLIQAEVLQWNHPETRTEVSISPEATADSSELCYVPVLNEEFDQVLNQICLEDVVLEDSMASHTLDHLWAYQNLESLLFDVEPNDPHINCHAQIEQDFSIYNYELSG